jgi:hypothetical protein
MMLNLVRATLLVLGLAGVFLVVVVSTHPLARVSPPAAVARLRSSEGVRVSLEEGLIARAVERPAFRADRRRSTANHDVNPGMMTDQSSPSPAKPTLSVSGIIWGLEPAAVVEGLPGTETSTVLRAGEASGGLKVIRISEDRVVVKGMDTTWRLTVREPRQ